jgi:hypothetical protein
MMPNQRAGSAGGATVILVSKSRRGTWLGVPYDWRRPTWTRIKRRWWNPRVNRLLTPRAFGWGYDIKVAALLRRLHLR